MTVVPARGELRGPWRRAARSRAAERTAVGSSRIRISRRGDQRLGDLDDLLHGDAERRRRGVRTSMSSKPKSASSSVGAPLGRAPVDHARTDRAMRHPAEQDVLGDAQMRQEAQLLVDGVDAELDRLARIGDRDRACRRCGSRRRRARWRRRGSSSASTCRRRSRRRAPARSPASALEGHVRQAPRSPS